VQTSTYTEPDASIRNADRSRCSSTAAARRGPIPADPRQTAP
jgi:hypothetical protein